MGRPRIHPLPVGRTVAPVVNKLEPVPYGEGDYSRSIPDISQVDIDINRVSIDRVETIDGVTTKWREPIDIADTDELIADGPVSVPDCYRWDIPGQSGYALTVDVDGDHWLVDLAHARLVAADYRVPVGNNEFRPLNASEKNWIATTEPVMVRDTKSIPLDTDAAIRTNERLKAENEAFAALKSLFGSLGIDVHNPQEWVDQQLSDAANVVKDAREAEDRKREALSAGITSLMNDLLNLRESTGFAPVAPYMAPEPDYSALTVVVGDMADAVQYPRLQGAQFVTRGINEPLTSDEKAGYEIMQRQMDEYWRTKAFDTEQRQIEAARSALRARIGE